MRNHFAKTRTQDEVHGDCGHLMQFNSMKVFAIIPNAHVLMWIV